MQYSTSLAASRQNPASTIEPGADRPIPGAEGIRLPVQEGHFGVTQFDITHERMPEMKLKPEMRLFEDSGLLAKVVKANEAHDFRVHATMSASSWPRIGEPDFSFLRRPIDPPLDREGVASFLLQVQSPEPETQQAACAQNACCVPFSNCAIL